MNILCIDVSIILSIYIHEYTHAHIFKPTLTCSRREQPIDATRAHTYLFISFHANTPPIGTSATRVLPLSVYRRLCVYIRMCVRAYVSLCLCMARSTCARVRARTHTISRQRTRAYDDVGTGRQSRFRSWLPVELQLWCGLVRRRLPQVRVQLFSPFHTSCSK